MFTFAGLRAQAVMVTLVSSPSGLQFGIVFKNVLTSLMA